MADAFDAADFTTKQLIQLLDKSLTDQLNRISQSVTELNAKLDLKASAVRVGELEAVVEELQKEVFSMRLASAGSAALTGVMKVVFAGVGATVIGSLVSLIVLAIHGGHL